MAAFESSYKSLLAGVSQQVPRERQPGQVSSQNNMLCDPVTNLRRRPGNRILLSSAWAGATSDSLNAWVTDIADTTVRIIACSVTGEVRVYDTDNTNPTLLASLQNDYLKAVNSRSIRGSAMGTDFFLCNTEVLPQRVEAGSNTNNRKGFIQIGVGAFSKEYAITVKVGTTTYTSSYTTPSGTTAGDAAKAAPEYIVNQLIANITPSGGPTLTAWGAAMYLVGSDTLSVVSSSGTSYVTASGSQYLNQSSSLPPSLPAAADGLIIGTGAQRAQVYYRYDSASQSWLEDGAAGSPTGLSGMPMRVFQDPDNSNAWTLAYPAYEGRLSGDDNTNPDPPFITNDQGITGMGTYQGRLVLLAGNQVAMSASGKAYRWYRSTVSTITSDDTIGIGSSANSSAAYQYCLPFMKDLLLFSEQYQALIPSGDVALTPNNATVLITSNYAADMTSGPVGLGRTVMYPSPRSDSWFGLKEMLPSLYTSSQYTSSDATAHLPKYLAGRCWSSVSSSVSNMVLFNPTSERTSLVVHEYLWDGDTKVQQAWHKWDFKYAVAACYFLVDRIELLFCQNGQLLITSIDPRAGQYTQDEVRRPFMDFWCTSAYSGNVIAVPAWLSAFDPDAIDDLSAAQADGDTSGEAIGMVYDATNHQYTTARSFESGNAVLGMPYQSSFSPTPPMILDKNGVKISSNKLTILRFMLSTTGSSEYEALVTDATFTDNDDTQEVGTLYWTSTELALGDPRIAGDSTAIIPARTNADTTTLLVSTVGLGELNVIALEYMGRYNQRYTRR